MRRTFLVAGRVVRQLTQEPQVPRALRGCAARDRVLPQDLLRHPAPDLRRGALRRARRGLSGPLFGLLALRHRARAGEDDGHAWRGCL